MIITAEKLNEIEQALSSVSVNINNILLITVNNEGALNKSYNDIITAIDNDKFCLVKMPGIDDDNNLIGYTIALPQELGNYEENYYFEFRNGYQTYTASANNASNNLSLVQPGEGV